jgi:hypothetical protein
VGPSLKRLSSGSRSARFGKKFILVKYLKIKSYYHAMMLERGEHFLVLPLSSPHLLDQSH